MKCVFLMVLFVSVLSQGLMAQPTSSDSNQQSTNDPLSQEVVSPTTESLSDKSKQSKAIVTPLPEDDESDDPQTTESDQEVEEENDGDEAEGSSRSARGLELGTYGKTMKRRSSPKSKGARPRRGHGSRYGPPKRTYTRPTKYGPPAKTYGPPANKYGQPQRYAPTTSAPIKYGPPSTQAPINYGPAVQNFAPSSHMEYVEKNVYNVPDNTYRKSPIITSYEDKLVETKEKPFFKRVPPSHVAVLPPKVIYGNPVPISFGPSDVTFKVPLTMTDEKPLPLTVMYQSRPSFSSQSFKKQPKGPINHANYHESVIPVTEPTFEFLETDVQTGAVTPSAKPNYEAASNYRIVSNEASNSHSDFDAIDKPTYEITMPVNYYGLPAYMSTGNTRYGGKYKFGYHVNDHASGNDFGHEEERDGELTDGRYHVLLPDGRVQNVNYHADTKGYYASVSYKKELQKRHQEKEMLKFEHDLGHLKRQSEDEISETQPEDTKTEESFAPYEN